MGRGPEPWRVGLEVPWLGLGSWVPQPSSRLLHNRRAGGRKQLVLVCKQEKQSPSSNPAQTARSWNANVGGQRRAQLQCQ